MRTSTGLDDRWQKEAAYCDFFSEETNSAKIRSAVSLLSTVIACELTQRQKECVSLYYYSGLTMAEIASRLGINKSSVSRAISRARARIERSMKYAMQMNTEN